MLVACGLKHTVCVDSCGNVWSFGFGKYGELGHGDSQQGIQVKIPRMIEGLEHIKQVSCGFSNTICLDQFGSLWSFGMNLFGQLGLGSIRKHFTPQKISKFGEQIQISQFSCGDSHVVCADTNGKCYSFGLNDKGQLGLGTYESVISPKLISSLEETFIVSVSCKGGFTLFLNNLGRVKSVGSNTSGQLGIGKISESVCLPQNIITLENVVAISAGYAFSLFLTSKNEVYSCGGNESGQLGHGNRITLSKPTVITDLPPIDSIGCGYHFSMFIDLEKNLWGSGTNVKGELGLGDIEDVDIPVQIPDVSLVSFVSQSSHQTLVKQQDGIVKVFGNNSNSQLLPEEVDFIRKATILEDSHILGNIKFSRAKSARK